MTTQTTRKMDRRSVARILATATACADCAGSLGSYPEIKGSDVVCSQCAMSRDYATAASQRNYGLFN